MENIWKIPKEVLKENYKKYKLNPANLLMNGPNPFLDVLFESIEFRTPEDCRIVLEEGLIKTYSAEKMKDAALKLFSPRIKSSQIWITDIPMGAKKVVFQGLTLLVPDIEENVEQLETLMRRGGYTLALTKEQSFTIENLPEKDREKYKDLENQKWVTLVFTPDFQNPRSMDDEAYLWHISPKGFEKSILEKGFIPRNKNNKFNYPDRIFFFRGSLPKDEVIKLYESVYESVPKDPGNRYIDYSAYVLYKISISRAGVNFYTDPDWTDKAVYTTENISPSAIISRENIWY